MQYGSIANIVRVVRGASLAIEDPNYDKPHLGLHGSKYGRLPKAGLFHLHTVPFADLHLR